MIQDLDLTLRELLTSQAPAGSLLDSAEVVFDLPNAAWRTALDQLTVNMYLYRVQENTERRTYEPLLQRSTNGLFARRVRAPIRIDCAYCITAWSTAENGAVLEEHRLLSDVLDILLRNPRIPVGLLQGSLSAQVPPYPTVIAAPDGVKNEAEFWGALDQQLKPSLNYVVTLAKLLDDVSGDLPRAVMTYEVEVDHLENAPE